MSFSNPVCMAFERPMAVDATFCAFTDTTEHDANNDQNDWVQASEDFYNKLMKHEDLHNEYISNYLNNLMYNNCVQDTPFV